VHVTEYAKTGAYRDAVIDGSPGNIVINGGFFNGKGGADIFYFDSYANGIHSRYSTGIAANMTIRGGSYCIQKVDYIRCIDANMTNDTDSALWIAGVAGILGGVILTFSTTGISGGGLATTISMTQAVGWASGGAAAGSSGIAALVRSPATPIVYEGTYGNMNIKSEYLKDINGKAKFTVDYDKENDSELDKNMTVFDYVPVMKKSQVISVYSSEVIPHTMEKLNTCL
jgi:hypothetical protein